MKTWVVNRWDLLRTNFLFFPLVMSAVSVACCFGLSVVDSHVDIPDSGPLGWLRAGGAEGVRSLLSALVGALVTALSVVFSITVVALTLAASQLGPRLLPSFMRDRANQLILGVTVSTFLYCLIALRMVGLAEGSQDIPHITILGGFLLAVAAFAVLIYFIHHVAESIQAPNVITAVCQELDVAIDSVFPDPAGRRQDEPQGCLADEDLEEKAQAEAQWNGYVQAIDVQSLVDFAREHDVVLKMVRRPGDFVAAGETLMVVHKRSGAQTDIDGTVDALRESLGFSNIPGARHRPTEARSSVSHLVILGSRRTATQDVEFVLLQLVEIATRALSPGINDPFTAMTCVDRLSAAMCRIARRSMPACRHYDDAGQLRLILEQNDFDGLLNIAFGQIRQSGRQYTSVIVRLLEGIDRIARQARTDEQFKALWRHAQMVQRAGETLLEDTDRRIVVERFDAVWATLRSAAGNVIDQR